MAHGSITLDYAGDIVALEKLVAMREAGPVAGYPASSETSHVAAELLKLVKVKVAAQRKLVEDATNKPAEPALGSAT